MAEKIVERIHDLATKNGWLLIGISGCTNCGKTTLCDRLLKKYPSSVMINQDTYFREEDDPNHIWVPLDEKRKHQNWESLECINWLDMCNAILDVVRKPSITRPNLLLIDGHIIYNYPPLAKVFNRKYFIRTYDKSMIYKRRIHRTYIPADPPGYFDQYVWPMYLKNLEELRGQKDIHYIDGSLSMEQIYRHVSADLDKFIVELKKN